GDSRSRSGRRRDDRDAGRRRVRPLRSSGGSGRVEGIFLTEIHGEVPQAVERVRAVAGGGLAGNQYFYTDGDAPPGRTITLVAAESVETFVNKTGIKVTPAETRRNVLTRGIDVNALVGKRFRIGDVKCVGVELCEPCDHLQ